MRGSELGEAAATFPSHKMHEAARELRFEYAARLRDGINEPERELREVS